MDQDKSDAKKLMDRRMSRKRCKSTADDKNDTTEDQVGNVAQAERKQLHDLHLQAAKEALEGLEHQWNDKIASQTKRFMNSATALTSKQQVTTPVAFVPSGLSVEEDKETFDMIESEVTKYTSLCARMSSFKCSNVKIAFQTICKQLNSPTSTTPRALREQLNTRFEGVSELVAILVEKAEYFTKNVFPQLLQLLSSADIPFLFIVGVGHCVNNFSRFIPSNCSTAFVYFTFETVSTAQRLNQFMYKILDANLGPITLDGKVVQYLCQHFQSRNVSVKRLFQAYRICLLEHYRKPESVLCRIPSESIDFMDDTFSTIAQLDGIRIPNGKTMTETVNECYTHIAHWSFILRMICFLQSSLQTVTPMDMFKDLYISCSSGSFFEIPTEGATESVYKRFLTDIKNLPKSGLTRVINQLCWELGMEDSKDDSKQGLVHTISDVYLQKTSVTDILYTLDKIKMDLDKLEDIIVEKVLDAPKPLPRLSKKVYKDRFEMQQAMKGILDGQSTSQPFYALRDSFIQFIEDLVTTYLKPFPSLLKGIQHKAFVFDDLQTLKSLFSPDPFSFVTNSLTSPSAILNCNCCRGVNSLSNVPSLPDTSIVFKLLKEQANKKVDLNNLFQAFLSILEAEQEIGRRRTSIKLKKLNEDSCLLRFRQAVAELQFTGVLKRSRTNPDEVTKLVWL